MTGYNWYHSLLTVYQYIMMWIKFTASQILNLLIILRGQIKNLYQTLIYIKVYNKYYDIDRKYLTLIKMFWNIFRIPNDY